MPGDDFARLHARALGDAEPVSRPRRLRGDRRLALRDDVAGGVQHQEMLRRVDRDDRRRLHGERARLREIPGAGRRAPTAARPASHSHLRRRRPAMRAKSRLIASLPRSGGAGCVMGRRGSNGAPILPGSPRPTASPRAGRASGRRPSPRSRERGLGVMCRRSGVALDGCEGRREWPSTPRRPACAAMAAGARSRERCAISDESAGRARVAGE